jgi:predicted Zn-dependent protease
LIFAADNEAELAGVMAHEIAHVAARHAMENQGKAQAIQLRNARRNHFRRTDCVNDCKTRAEWRKLSFFKFSRGAEEEADKSRRSVSLRFRLRPDGDVDDV